MKKTLSLLLIFFLFVFQGFAQRTSPMGKWKTIDDNTGKTKSIVEIVEKNGKLFGNILELFDPEKPDPVCEECDEDDSRYMKPIVGMEIIQNMEKDDEEWEDGHILDPENGKVYRCKLWVEEGQLKVRGYIAFLYRTQTWLPVD
ncbi:MAG: DUF2147 domain-containing protein [Flavobacteriales bacterium]|nr:DUF2147 domain-containing protein [Flavobacteriales bacterium]